MRDVLASVLAVFFAIAFMGASCHPAHLVKKPEAPPPKEEQRPAKPEPKREEPSVVDSTIEEEVIEPEVSPQPEERRHRQTSPTLAAAENMAREALAMLRDGNAVGAALTAERAIGLDSQCGYCYYALASIRAAQRMWDEVIPLATSALQYLSDKRAAKAAYIRALAYYHTGELDRAEADCKYALTLDPTLKPAKRLLKSIY